MNWVGILFLGIAFEEFLFSDISDVIKCGWVDSVLGDVGVTYVGVPIIVGWALPLLPVW